MRNMISTFFGVTNQIERGRYLGLPSIIGRSKKAVFGYLKGKIWSRINHSARKHYSKASKEVLVKSCAQEIHSYCMSVYLLPTSLEDEMQKMMNSFYWRSKHGSSRGINWLN